MKNSSWKQTLNQNLFKKLLVFGQKVNNVFYRLSLHGSVMNEHIKPGNFNEQY
jgi:hypothetical protein